jgi:hypothetical protein
MKRFTCPLIALLLLALPAVGAPGLVAHEPASAVFGEPASTTQRAPLAPREGEATRLWIKIGPSFSYDAVAIYFTTDGSDPQGSRGIPQPGTRVLLSFGPDIKVGFVRNEGSDDWWVADLPIFTRLYATNVRYRIGAWQSQSGDPEVFAGDNNVYDYTTLLAWPGSGSGTPSPEDGYPNLHFWKEEAVAGNNYINVMLDQNGSIYDVYYPSAGAVNGISTKNEGYDAPEEHPAGLVAEQRGQMHMNQAFLGLRPTNPGDGSGLTYWLTNQQGADYQGVSQQWLSDDSNVVRTTQTLAVNGNDVTVVQTDFAPKGVVFPTDNGGNPNRGLMIKRVELTNNDASPVELNVYFFADWALNGGDQFDGTFTDAPRGAMVGFDTSQRFANAVGEYNPTTFSDYEKNVSVYLAAAMRVSDFVGAASGTPATDFWSDTSADQGVGWLGSKVTLAPGETREIAVLIVGGFDDFAGAVDTYAFQQAPVIDWFLGTNLQAIESDTHAYWQTWLAAGVGFASPDPAYTRLLKRGLLGTALHLDGKNGGIIAGMHNGAYPFVWPRDGAWAAITLARAGFVDEAKEIVRFLRDITFRDVEGWGRLGFWKQKYTTDGYTIWANPQVDETSCFPWMTRYIYDVEGDVGFLDLNYDAVFDAGLASSQDSTVDGQLRYEDAVDLMFSMNLWEDTFDVTIYANASVVRGLEDAAAIAGILDQEVCPGGPGTCNYHNDKALFEQRAADIRGGLDARLDWNGENTDISQLGITYPFEIYPAGSPRPQLVLDRINGFQPDTFGNFHPLVQTGGVPEWTGLVDRYWGDSYWAGGPWFLTTLWFGAYHAERQDVAPGKADIDLHKQKIDLLLPNLGPMGFGAEQIAPDSALKYPGQTDYRLQTAYPNAWESMSFLADAVMLFLGFDPDMPGETLRVRPKLPSDWSWMEYSNLTLGSHRIDVRVEEDADGATHTFTNNTADNLLFDTVLRIPTTEFPCEVRINGVPTPFAHDPAIGAVAVNGQLATGFGSTTTVTVRYTLRADINADGGVDVFDFSDLAANFGIAAGATRAQGDTDGDGDVDVFDFSNVAAQFGQACP